MEKPKGQGSDPKTGGSKTEQRRGSFKKKHPYRADKPATIDTLKERVNPHIPLLKPGSIGDLLTFKHRLSDHVRSHFTLNGNLFQSGSYYDGRETLSLLHAARASIVKINRRTAGTTTPQSSDASADEEDDEEDAQTEEGHDDQQSPDALVQELDRLVSSLPKKSRIKVLDAQLSQGARALLQNRLDSEAEKVKIFALLLSKISEASLALLRNAPEAETLLLEANDPLKLWSTIEMTHMGGSSNHDTQIYQILRAYQTARQDNLESIHTYYERFIQIVSTMESYGAPLDPPYLQARHFLQQLDRAKYGKFLTDLHNLVTSGALPSYPRSVAEAYNLAKERVEPTSAQGNNRFANPVVFSTIGDSPKEKKATKKKDKKVVRTKGSNPPPGTCDLCGQTGHFIRSCPRLEDAKQAVSKDGGRFTAATFGFEGSESVFMAHSARTVKLRDTDILLDTQANISVFRNRELLTDVHDTADGVTISGFVQGNAERTSCIGSFLGVEPVYLAPNGAANILSFNQLERGDHDISWARNSHFDVRFSGVNISLRFHVRANGLYVADGSKFAKEMGQVMVTTVAQREAAYPPDQLKRAKEARRLQERLGHVSTDALVRSLNHGVLINAPVTAADVLRAHDIYGPSEQLLHGTKKRDKQKPMGILEFVPRPVQTELILLADIMQVENDTYLISVSYPLRLTMTAFLPDKKAPTVANALVDQVDNYAAKGFKVTRVITDPEATLRAAGALIRRHGIDHDETGVEQHVARVEAMIKLVKERTRSLLHGLPYRLPSALVKHAVQYSVRMLNAMAPKEGLHGTSPRELFLGRKTDLRRDFRVPFGEYCHVPVYSGTRNSMQSRTLPAISLGGKGNATGSAEFFVLTTKRIVSRDHWTLLPMPQDSIDFLNSLSDKKENVINIETHQDVKPSAQDLPFPQPTFKVVEEHKDQELDQEDEQVDPEPAPQEESVEQGPILEAAANDCEFDQPEVDSNDAEPLPDPEPPPIQTSEDGEKEGQESPPHDLVPQPPASQPRHRLTYLRPSLKRNSHVYNDSYVYNISVTEGIKKHGQAAEDSIRAELNQMVAKQVWEPAHYRQVPQGSVVIPSFVFLKEKYDASGNFMKIKSRLVAGGHMQNAVAGEETSSPTASLTAIMMVAAIAAEENRRVLTLDIGGAYLNAPMKSSRTFMVLDKRISDVMTKIDPSYRDYVTKKGTIIVRLKKALYGCKESGLLWYETLSEFLRSEGYIANPYDKCVMNLVKNGVQTTVVIYVDDLLITSCEDTQIESLLDSLRTRFEQISVNRGKVHSYLGMKFNFQDGSVEVDMHGYETEVLATHSVDGVSTSPASRDLFTLMESPVLDQDERAKFHTVVAKLAYLAKRTRPDILTAISFLSTRVQSPTKADGSKLVRVLKYLKHTGTRSIKLVKKCDYPIAYVDASYGVHAECRSQTGIMITLGDGPIFVRSVKQKINSKSSTEAELIALSDAMGDIVWSRELLIQQQNYKKTFVSQPAIIYEDNQSTLKLLDRKRTFAGATKHVNIRYFFYRGPHRNK